MQRVESYMHTHVAVLPSDAPLRAAVEAVKVGKVSHICVEHGDRFAGIISDRDILRVMPSPSETQFARDYEQWLDQTPVGRIMTRHATTVDPETSLRRALFTMLRDHVHALPVVQDGRLVGLLDDRACLSAFQRLLATHEREIEELTTTAETAIAQRP